MRAVVLDGKGGLSIEDRPMPETPPGEALVRVRIAGVCATDLELSRGYMGFRGTPGHEFVGEVVRAPDDALIGRRVAGEINASCGTCAICVDGLPRHCPARSVLGILSRPGAFAEYLTLPVANLHPLPDDLSDDRAVFVEPLAAAYEVLEQVPVAAAPTLVLGDGRLGSLIARVLARAGARLTVLGRHDAKLAPLRDEGIDARGPGDEAPAAKTFAVVVDATGSPEGLAQAIRFAKPRGTIVLKTTSAGRYTLDLAPIVIDELSIVGSRCGPFEPAIEALHRGELAPEATIDARFPLEEAGAALRRAAAPGVRKVVIDMPAG